MNKNNNTNSNNNDNNNDNNDNNNSSSNNNDKLLSAGGLGGSKGLLALSVRKRGKQTLTSESVGKRKLVASAGGSPE